MFARRRNKLTILEAKEIENIKAENAEMKEKLEGLTFTVKQLSANVQEVIKKDDAD